jgi:VCBS repeat-containing protein
VGQGGSFVELDTILRGGVGGDGAGRTATTSTSIPTMPMSCRNWRPRPSRRPTAAAAFDEGRNGFIQPVTPVIVVTGDDTGRVADGESTVADGRLAAREPAPGAALTWTGSATGTFGTFTVSPDGEWRYIASPAIARLDEGETAVETFAVVITDAAGLTATQTITITVVGAGDNPVAVTPAADTVRTIAEAVGATTGGRLLATDPDAGAVLAWSGNAAGTYGTFTVTPAGNWTYVAGPAVRQLAQGQTAAEVFTATVTDQTGRTATQTVTVTIGGANDAPVSTTTTANASGTVTDGAALLASGMLTASDPDAGATLTWSGGGTSPFGTFTVQPDGTWTFTGNAAIDALPQSARVTETFTATVTDDRGATATQAVVVTILGTNDAPVATDGEFETDKGAPVAGQLSATDVDTGDVLTFGLGARCARQRHRRHRRGRQLHLHAQRRVPGPRQLRLHRERRPGRHRDLARDRRRRVGQRLVRRLLRRARHHGRARGAARGHDPVDRLAGRRHRREPRHRARPVGQHRRDGMAGPGEPGGRRDRGAGRPLRRGRDVGRRAGGGLCDLRHHHADLQPDRPGAHHHHPRPALHRRGTNYAAALTLTESFFDSQPAGEANFLYFITDGVPTENTWPTVLNRLTNETVKGYDVQIEAFGIGSQINFGTLSQLDPNPQLLSGAQDLTDAFTATPLFSADLVSLTVELIATA